MVTIIVMCRVWQRNSGIPPRVYSKFDSSGGNYTASTEEYIMASHPVVIYGASGYTGMLVIDWVIDQRIPFTAIARDAKRVQEMMEKRVVRLEAATYEVIEAEHSVEALKKAFKGDKID